MIKNEYPNGRSEVTLIPRVGLNALKVILPFTVDHSKPEDARDLALKHAREAGIDVSDYENAN
ncbi:hypothetical protein [Variovorax sp. JS1663]|uniref:hypothetical protein n=1 Tax=Variovorax sp. JS1663 TaxID=1851577 RepID=UPI000B343EF1|nr:hypothetical protein [Variovorax sp. JS1663]OUL98763.1 hypothetical protein A8M77_29925 [Variovorax sp. JS1663]